MTKVAILPESTEPGRVTYRAIAGVQQSVGKTAGEALDALTSTLTKEASATMVIVQHQRPDEFFSATQQARLKELMLRWRAARDAGSALAPTEQNELDALVEAETRAAGERPLRCFGNWSDEPALPAGRATCRAPMRVLPRSRSRLQFSLRGRTHHSPNS